MKKPRLKVSETRMSSEYDFSGGIRGKYARRYARGANVVLLDPDVAKIFPDSRSVNRALRTLAELARKQRKASAK
jgi:hypothetical protein